MAGFTLGQRCPRWDARLAGWAEPDGLVATQGHVLTARDLMATLAVEATVHHLDLAELPTAARPSAAGLAAVRAALGGLLGGPVPVDWSDEHYARAGTGRDRRVVRMRAYADVAEAFRKKGSGPA